MVVFCYGEIVSRLICYDLGMKTRIVTLAVFGLFVTGLSVFFLKTSYIFNSTSNLAALSGANSGLIAYYTFEEGQGAAVSDSSGSGNNATVTGTPQWGAGKVGNSSIDVSNGSAVLTTIGLYNYPFSFCAWVKPTQSGNIGYIMESAAFQIFHLGFERNSLQAYNSIGTVIGADGSVVLNTWQYVCGTADTSNIVKLYSNANLVKAGDVSNPQIGSIIKLGQWFTGQIDEVRMYNRVLSEAEILELYNENSAVNNGTTAVNGSCGSTENVCLSGTFQDTADGSGTKNWQCVGQNGGSTASCSVAITGAPDTTAPTISSVAASSVTQSGATISWTTDEASDSQVEYGLTTSYGNTTQLDGTLTTAHNAIISSLSANTTYNFRVKSKDSSGNSAVSANSTFTTSATAAVDTQAPSAPTGVTANAISASQVSISWSESTDNVGVVGYRVYRNGTQVGTPSTPPYTNSGLAANTTYSYTVAAVDAAGNVSAQSSSVTATTQSQTTTSSNELVPSSRLVDWTPGVTVGVPGGIPSANYTKCVTAECQALENAPAGYKDGSLSPTGLLDAAIKSAPAKSYVYLPAGKWGTSISFGNWKGEVVVRGAGMDQTVVGGTLFMGTGNNWNYPTVGNSVTGGLSRGSTRINIADTSAFNIGILAKIVIQENDPSIPVISVAGFSNIRSQIVQITGKTSNSLTFFPPLYDDYGGSSVHAKVYANQIQSGYIGVEDMTIDVGGGASYGAMIQQCHACWIKNVRMKMANNYNIGVFDSLFFELRSSYLDALNRAGGTNGAGLLMNGDNASLIEDNIVVESFPNFEINMSSSGNVFAYNFTNNANGLIGINTNHAPHNQYNLYEGNITHNLMSDGYFGSESDGTLFRNWFTGAPLDANNNKSQTWCLSLKRFTRRYSLVGNIFGSSGISNPCVDLAGLPNIGNGSWDGQAQPSAGDYWDGWDPSVGTTITGTVKQNLTDYTASIEFSGGRLLPYQMAFSTVNGWVIVNSISGNTATIDGSPWSSKIAPAGTTFKLWGGAGGFQEQDLDVRATTHRKGNYYYGTNAIPSDEALGSLSLSNSLYLDSKPVWFGSLSWPPFNPNNPSAATYDSIPAGYRYMHKTGTPGYSGNGSGPVQSSFTLTVTKAGAGSGTVSGSTISCGSTCSKSSISSGTSITLTATPATGSTFTGWSGGGCTGTGSCTVTILTNTTVTATFSSATQVLNGSCGVLENTCLGGTLLDVTDTSTQKKWSCVGLNGGTTASCSVAITTDPSNPQSGTTDTTLPSITITAPQNNASVSGTAVVLAATASDNVGVQSVQWKLDGDNLGEALTTAPYSGTWNSTLVANGNHTISATARDISGNTKAVSVAVKVANVVAPDTQAPSVPTNLVSSSITQTGATISWNASTDNVGVVSYRVYQGGTLVSSPLSNSYVATGLAANSSYSFTVSAVDAAGNTSAQSTSITVKTSATPVTTYTLTVSKTGLGRVTGPGISCGSSCSTTVTPGTRVTLTASPSSDYTFANWTDSCSGNDNSCSITINRNTSVGVVFVSKGTGGPTTVVQPFTPTVPQKSSGPKLTRDFGVGASGEDVRSLQKFLNTLGYTISKSGAGSPGQETTLFGGLTKTALMKYQAANGIPATGYVGPLTRAKIGGSTTTTTTTTTTKTPTTTTTKPATSTTVPSKTTNQPSTGGSLYLTVPTTISQTLALGSKGGEVILLQQLLSTIPGIYPEKKQSGTFDSATELAVQRFQVKYNLSKPGDTGYGIVGPTTRAKLNSLKN